MTNNNCLFHHFAAFWFCVTAIAGAPVVLIAFGVDLVVMTVFNYFEVNKQIGAAADHALTSHGH